MNFPKPHTKKESHLMIKFNHRNRARFISVTNKFMTAIKYFVNSINLSSY